MSDADNAALITARIEELADDLIALSRQVHEARELGFAESKSVAAVADLLARHGVPAQVGCYGLDTALRAQVGSGGPQVGVFAEYDALPGIGHGCGHNVICAAGVGAFLGAAEAARRVGGSVTLFGTPAEENGSGKELMAQAGAFDDLDAAVMLHPGTGDVSVSHASSVGLRSVEVSYHGRAAHASAAPHAGRNALDAVVMAYQGIAALRQHIVDTDRVHGIIIEGGQAANIVPELARARFLLRASDTAELVAFSERVQRVLVGAALMTETRLEAHWDQVPPNLPVRANTVLADRFALHLSSRGYPVTRESPMRGSTDLGNVSLRLPAIHPWLAIAPAHVVPHTTEFAACAAGPRADRAVVDGAVALALTVSDFLADEALRARVADDFARAGGKIDVAALMRPPR